MWWEYRKMSIRGLMVGPKTNSPNYQHMNCIADNKKNYWWEIGSDETRKKEKIRSLFSLLRQWVQYVQFLNEYSFILVTHTFR